MTKILFCAAAIILASPAFSDQSRINTTRDGGGYEASLRGAGVPLSGGLAWATHIQAPVNLAPVQLADVKMAPTRVAAVKVAKSARNG